MDGLRATLSYLLSFVRRSGHWQFSDYPVRIKCQNSDDAETEYPPYCAQIINWWTLTGLGESPRAARDNLRENFEKYKQNNDTIPRPGSRAPIQFAESSVVESDPEIYRRFIVDVLGFGPEDPVFISDESSLFDFDGVNEGIDLIEQTRVVFGVDVSDIADGKTMRCTRSRTCAWF